MAALLLAACTATYPVVGRFSDHNEVFLGTVNADLMSGQSFIEAKGKNTGLRCHGLSRVLYIPTASYLLPVCAGQRGIAVLRCDDGRRLEADWEATSCTSGHGGGDDNRGARFEFAFGMSEQEAAAKLGIYQEEVSAKPDLPVYRPGEARKKQGVATGTGFFISSDGHLLTNHHVVDGATSVSVMIDGNERTAKVVRSDATLDFALLKVEGHFQPLPIGTSSRLERADEVFTLGYPLTILQGNAQKATFGRVNALSGPLDDPHFIQIDVPIQPGNSGGPLITREGNVVGVTTMTLSTIGSFKRTGAFLQNINFAGKIDGARPLLTDVQTRPPVAGSQSLQALIQNYEKSVVLVISR
ncbi:MAG TPA: serine protease [Reyranella sp.]|nr:serine protease [Reyranella sp.]